MLEKPANSDPLITELRTVFARPIWKKEVAAYADLYGDQPGAMNTLLNLSLEQQNEVGFRASWILEYACISNKLRLIPILPSLVSRFKEQSNISAKRHFGKIICLIASSKSPKAVRDLYHQQDMQAVTETLFEWLVSDMPVAVKANALEALALLIPRYPWIKDELLETIDHLIDRESIAFYGRVKKIRPKILKY